MRFVAPSLPTHAAVVWPGAFNGTLTKGCSAPVAGRWSDVTGEFQAIFGGERVAVPVWKPPLNRSSAAGCGTNCEPDHRHLRANQQFLLLHHRCCWCIGKWRTAVCAQPSADGSELAGDARLRAIGMSLATGEIVHILRERV